MKGDNAIMIRWGLPPPGREHRALEVLRAAADFFLVAERGERIGGFQQFGYNTGPLHERVGFFLLEGSRDQMQTLLFSEDFKEQLRRLALVTTNVSCDLLELGEAMKRRLEGWNQAVQEMRGSESKPRP